MSDTTDRLERLERRIREFAAERNWEEFRTPRNLMLALTGEVGELATLMQWIPDASIATWAGDETNKARLEEEIADVLIYLLQLADSLGIDVARAAEAKAAANAGRYPVSGSRGD